ncbi:MAG TPA: hypothetical protein VLM80_07280 [Anaerolineales bacterium]|nr:hypothetical protein [Anaerolineales bacterium]
MSANQQNSPSAGHKFWSLPDEIYRSLHQWHLMLAFLVLGALLGWGLSFLLPAEYKATQNIYVGLNPYRAFSDANFLAVARPAYSNIDDYKNWQMSQLETVIFLGDFIQASLDLLRQQDPFWQQITYEQLSSMLDTDWRTAGVWSLTATHHDALRAEQAARAWKDVAVTKVDQAILAARQTFMVDQELQANSDASLQAQLRIDLLDETRSALIAWIKTAEKFPAYQPLTPVQRDAILALGLYPAQFSPAWSAILEGQPAHDAKPGEYITWAEGIITQIQFEVPLLYKRISQLEIDHQEIADRYAVAADLSLGISPNLTFEGFAELPARPMRSSGLWVLLGSLTGLLTWVLTQLVMINKRLSVL